MAKESNKAPKDAKGISKKNNKTSAAATTVTDFPRGGSNGLTPLEFREVTRQAEREAIFADGVTGEKKDRKKRRSGETVDAATQSKKKKRSKATSNRGVSDGVIHEGEGEDDEDLLDDARMAKVENLTTKKLTKGALILGCVSAIHELELRIALPNGLVGVVPITSISPEMTAFVEKAAGDAESDDEDANAMDVDADEMDDPLDLGARFFVGQFVKCVVAEVGSEPQASAAVSSKKKKKSSNALRVELSLVPEEINSRIDPDDVCEGMVITASVKSVEDRGYVLNTGLPGRDVAAFLPSDDAQPWIERWMPDAEELKVGQLIEAAVTSVSADRRSMRFTINPKAVAESEVKDTYKTMASIQPGQLVSATIIKVWNSGLSLRFMGFYDCSANLRSIGMLGASGKDEVEKGYPFGDTIKVRVLYVSLTAAAKTILVSTSPHILQFRSRPASTGYELPNAACLAAGRAPVSDNSAHGEPGTRNGGAIATKSSIADKQMWPIPYGTILDDCVVVNTIGSKGLAMHVTGVDSVQAYAAAAQVVDEGENIPALSKHAGRFCIGTHHRARVVGYDPIDATVLLSLRPSAVNNALFSISDMRPGMLVTGTVRAYNDKGASIDISPQIRGFIFKEDLSDIPLKHPELHFKTGKEIVCRVLKALWDQNKITLTARKSLVKSKLPIVCGYTEEEGAVPGVIAQATVIRAVNNGFVAGFYQGAVCLVSTETKAPAKGQVVKCRILKVNSARRHILASLDVDPATSLDNLLRKSSLNKASSEYSKDVSQVAVGQMVSGVVVGVREKNINICIDGSNLLAYLKIGHLSDHRGDVLEKIRSHTSAGDRIEELVVTSRNEKRGVIDVSAKKSLIKAAKAKCTPSSAEDLVVGSTCVGWIETVVDFGAFVSFLGSCKALVPLENISDRFIHSAKDFLDADQTVVVSIDSIDQTDGEYRVRASMKESTVDISATGCLEPGDLLADYFDSLKSTEGTDVLESIGSQTLVSVKQKHAYGVVVAPVEVGSQSPLSKIASGFVTKQQAKERMSECTGNAVVAACVLDVDQEKGIADYSLRSALVPNGAALEKAAAEGDPELLSKVLENCSAKAAATHKALKDACREKKHTQLIVEVVKEDYLVLSMPHLGNAVCFALAKTYNDRSRPFMRFKPGQRLSGTLIRAEANKRTLVQLDPITSRSKDDTEYGAEFTDVAVVQPVDPSVKRFGDYSEGFLTVARVADINGNQANLEFASNVRGRLHVTELFDDDVDIDAEAKDAEAVFGAAGVYPGEEVKVKVLGTHDAKASRFIPITHKTSPIDTVLEATIRASELKKKGSISQFRSRLVALRTAKGGHAVRGFVSGIGRSKDTKQPIVLIDLGIHLTGVLPMASAARDFAVASAPSRYFTPGMPIEVQVVKMDTASKEAQVAPHGKYITGVDRPFESVEELVPGTHVVASVSKTMTSVMFVNIELSGKVVSSRGSNEYRQAHASGMVNVFNAADNISENVFGEYSKGQLLEAVVLSVDAGKDGKGPTVKLSTRPSVLDPSKATPESVADPLVSSAADVRAGQVVRGFVEKTTQVGCFVSLGPRFNARALISELSDEYVRDVASAFPAGKFVTGIVLSTNPERNQAALSLKPSRVGNTADADGNPKRRLDQISVGETLKGTVTRIEDYGVFIRPDDAFLNGLCYVREIADSETPVDPKALYEIGDRVLAKVLKVDVDANRLSLGLKTSYFTKDGDEESEGDDSEANSDASADEKEEEEDDDGDDDDDNDAESSSDEAMSVDNEAESDDEDKSADEMDVDDAAKNSLPVANGFRWDDEAGDDDGDDGSDADDAQVNGSDGSDDEVAHGSKKTKSSKTSKVTQDITADLSEQAPKRAVDFERLIVGSPNSSFLWLQFMAFYLGQSEVDQARDVAERALKTVSMNEVQEKMNIWVALLNLEHRFGSPETLEAALKRAVQYMNPKHIYLQMAKIYERADQLADAERMHKVAISKFSGSCKVWVLFGLFYLKSGKVVESRDLLARALKALPKRKHIKAITQFGQMEFKNGEPERGRTVFEGVLGTYPKRVDLWSVYLDMEVKAVTSRGLHASDASGKCWSNARSLFERVTSMKFSSKKMKFLFKKWLGFEKTHGSEATIEHVKDRALEYINSLGS
ncbi:rRNA biogenesis protein rrp5 [Coemansia sp. RSA 1646]|nr:rRNA biogenesis protein rrp5 [Coemansia sp. RSA 1646]